jgi:uncharacterized protein (UPF0548 family)
MTAAFTYSEVGATRDGGPLPPAYSHLRHRVRIGRGEAEFRAAAEALGTFRMHRRLPVGVNASAPRAEPDADVTVTLAGLVHAPCRIVWVVDEPGRYGWAYGTLTGHPECGEEAFLLALGPDGDVWFEVVAFSRPGGWAARLLGRSVPVMQRLYARRCGQVLRRIARSRSAVVAG